MKKFAGNATTNAVMIPTAAMTNAVMIPAVAMIPAGKALPVPQGRPALPDLQEAASLQIS
jgi:hypothetical protein